MARAATNFSIAAEISALLRNGIDGNARYVSVNQALEKAIAISVGTSANQADMIFVKNDIAILAGANKDLDLYDLGADDWFGYGVNKDAVGLAWAAVEIVGLFFFNDTTSAGTLKVGGEGSAAAFNSPFDGSDTAKIGPFGAGGLCQLINPVDPAWVVTGGSNHLLRLAAVGGNITVDAAIVARSA